MSQNSFFDYFLPLENRKKKPVPQLGPDSSGPEKTSDEGAPFFSDEALQSVATDILNRLKELVPPPKFSAYFENTFLLDSITSSTVCFSVTTPFIKSMIEEHFLTQISDVITDHFKKKYLIDIKISDTSGKSFSSNKLNILNSIKIDPAQPRNVHEARFTIDLTPTKDDLAAKAESRYLQHTQPEESGIQVDTKKTFATFVVGSSNNMAVAAAKAVAQNPGKTGKYPSLYIYSGPGLGKTHLLHAVANEINEKFPELVVYLTTARDFMSEMINSIRNNSIAEFRGKYSKKIDVLMVDDIHELKGKEGTQDEFFHIFNELHNKGKQLIFTSDKSPSEIDGIAERIKTRLQWGLVIDIQKPDLETRIAILKRKAYELDLFLGDDIFVLIANRITSSIRELEGSLIKLSALTELMKVEIDAEIVRDSLGFDKNTTHQKISLEDIAKATSSHYKIPLGDLKSKARDKDIAHARHVAMYLSQKLIPITLKEIGRFYGGRDHSTVIHGIEKVSLSLKGSEGLTKDILYIESSL